jgi:hypothetical protein
MVHPIRLSRRALLRFGLGALGLSLPDYLGLRCLRAGATPPAAHGQAS